MKLKVCSSVFKVLCTKFFKQFFKDYGQLYLTGFLENGWQAPNKNSHRKDEKHVTLLLV